MTWMIIDRVNPETDLPAVFAKEIKASTCYSISAYGLF